MSTIVKQIRGARVTHLKEFSELLSIPSISTDSLASRTIGGNVLVSRSGYSRSQAVERSSIHPIQ